MKRTLYLTDLDGTLLTPDAKLSPITREILARLKLPLSCATARSAATVVPILEGVTLPYPVILMNGALTYDMASAHYTHVNTLPREALPELFRLFRAFEAPSFAYVVKGDQLFCYFEQLRTEQQRWFYEERTAMGKKMLQIDHFEHLLEEPLVYLTACAPESLVKPLTEAVRSSLSGLNLSYYRDVYTPDYWWLEIAREGATKANAARQLMQDYGFDELVVFGDNLNDLPMFEVSDRCYAVANAHPDVLARATAVIGPNTEDGVAHFLEQEV